MENNKSYRNLRGQAAMEYLMTYGWAILVILIVLAILAFYLPQFIKAQDQCTFSQTGFTCGDSRPLIFVSDPSNTVQVSLRVFNQNGQNVNIKKILCTTNAPGNVDESFAEDPNLPQGKQSLIMASGSSYDFNAKCWKDKANGNQVVLSPTSDFRGYFFIWYNLENDPGGKDRLVQASITGTIVK